MEKSAVWYELVYRGISVGTHPKKGYLTSDFDHINSKGFEYGAVAYARDLTDSEVYEYELKKIEAPRELTKSEKQLFDLLK